MFEAWPKCFFQMTNIGELSCCVERALRGFAREWYFWRWRGALYFRPQCKFKCIEFFRLRNFLGKFLRLQMKSTLTRSPQYIFKGQSSIWSTDEIGQSPKKMLRFSTNHRILKVEEAMNSASKKMEIAWAAMRNGFNTATYTFRTKLS